MKMHIRLELDPAPVRHIAVQCPSCKRWFHGQAIADNWIQFEHEINFTKFDCPVCGHPFGAFEYGDEIIIDTDYKDIYEGCLQKKETWE